jgi:hypothetical protein
MSSKVLGIDLGGEGIAGCDQELLRPLPLVDVLEDVEGDARVEVRAFGSWRGAAPLESLYELTHLVGLDLRGIDFARQDFCLDPYGFIRVLPTGWLRVQVREADPALIVGEKEMLTRVATTARDR